MATPQLERRTLLKAATAAGIVWASPFVQSVTAHAASDCASAQFNDELAPETTSPPSSDGVCTDGGTLSACAPGGMGSLCTCSFETGQMTPTGGSWSGSAGTGYTYTAPPGCTIVDARARVDNVGVGSGCANEWPCVPGTINTATKKSVTFPALGPTSGSYWKFRMVLCCTT